MRLCYALLTALFVVSCATSLQAQDQPRPSLQGKQVKIAVDSICSLLNRYYIYPEKAAVMNRAIKSHFKKGAYKKISDPIELAQKLNADLQKSNPDIHLGIRYAPRFDEIQKAEHERQEENRKMQLAFLEQNNFLFEKVQILPGNIGYVKFTGFNEMVSESKRTLNAVFTFLENTQAVIIDLRENRGGSPEMVAQIQSYFFPERTHMMDIVDRVDDKTYEMWADPVLTDSLTLSVPLYILTSQQTASGAEDFSYGMQGVERAVVVGETTAGGAHLTRPFSAGQGFVIAIPFARSLNPYTHSNWEGTGVKPDIEVPSSGALVKAQELFFNEQLSAATSEQQKRKIQWNLHKLQADHNHKKPIVESLMRYTGLYAGGLDIYVDDAELFCKNGERGNAIFPMQWVGGHLFILDENVIVEFVKDDLEKYSSINMLWKGGGVSKKPRLK